VSHAAYMVCQGRYLLVPRVSHTLENPVGFTSRGVEPCGVTSFSASTQPFFGTEKGVLVIVSKYMGRDKSEKGGGGKRSPPLS